MRAGTLLDSLRQDVRFALRTLGRSPLFTTVALITLALGIGANTAVFSVVNGILLTPLPYPNSSQLVAIGPNRFASMAELDYLQRHARSYVGGAAAFSPGWGVALSRPDAAVQLSGARTSANFFGVLGATPLLGRTFVDGESSPGRGFVVILSHALWQAQFGGDRRIVGRAIVLDGTPYTVIGVMPPGFSIFQQDAQIWMPLEIDPGSSFFKGSMSFLVGRLESEDALPQANAELRSLVPDLRRTFAFEEKFGEDLTLLPLRELVTGSLRPTLLVLLGAVGFLLLIAGSNVGNLLLVRAGGRAQEMAVRSALGASRARVVRQLMIESTLLAAGGGALGLASGIAGVRALRAVLPAEVPRADAIVVDVRVLVVCLVVTLGIGVLFGLAPALFASRNDLQGTLRGARGTDQGRAGGRLRGALVVAEVALALVLVIGAGLMIQTMWRLTRLDPGFRGDGVLTVRTQPTGPDFDEPERRVAYFEQALAAARGIPGVEAVGAIQHLPLTGFDWHRDTEIEGHPAAPGAAPFRPGARTVAGDYFRAMGIPLLAGRSFAESDREGSAGVAVINRAFAERYFAGENPIGRRIRPQRLPWLTIVGVVGDVRHVSLATPAEPEFFVDVRQFLQSQMSLVARTSGDPLQLARAMYERVAAVDRTVPVSDLRPMSALAATSVATPRVVTMLLLAFAVVGLVLGAVGIYGVVSYTVSSRRREIGIHLALGARRSGVTAMVVREGVGYAAAGVSVGILAALGLSRAMESLLFGVRPNDASTFAVVSLVLLGVAALASYVPALRAARIDPAETLRSE